MAARLRADADNQAGSFGRNLQTLKGSVSANLKRSLAYSKAKGFSMPVACYRRKRSQQT